MTGMATPEQLDALAAARGAAFDLVLVRLMHTHRAEGLPMAQAVIDRTDVPAVAELDILDAVALRISGGTTRAAADGAAAAHGDDDGHHG